MKRIKINSIYYMIFLIGILVRFSNPVNAQFYGQGGYKSDPGTVGMNITDLYTINPQSDSFVDREYPNVAVLTTDGWYQNGSLYSKRKVDLSREFHLKGSLYIGEGRQPTSENGFGDGMAFVLQNDPRGTDAIGAPGQGMGYQFGNEGRRGPLDYIKNSVAFELDTHFNDTNSYDNDQNILELAPKNGLRDHMGWIKPPDINHNNPVFFSSGLASDNWREFNIDYVPNNSGGAKITGLFNGKRSTYDIKNVQENFKTTHEVYWGIVGSTGGDWEVNALRVDRIIPFPDVIASKFVRNEDGDDIDFKKVYKDQKISYELNAVNQGTDSAKEVQFIDDLPDGVNLDSNNAELTDENGNKKIVKVNVNKKTLSYTITDNKGVLHPGKGCSLKFNVVVNGKEENVKNYGKIIADHVTKYTNNCMVYFNSTLKNVPKITKKVKNMESNKESTEKISVDPGTPIQYQIKVSASDVGNLDHIRIRDVIPPGFAVSEGALSVYEYGQKKTTKDVPIYYFNSAISVDDLQREPVIIKPGSGNYVLLTVNGSILPTILSGINENGLPRIVSNTASLAAYGDIQEKWISNKTEVNINVPKPKLVKSVRLSNNKNSKYMDKLDADSGDSLDYKVTIFPDKNIDAPLSYLEIQDSFLGQLGKELDLKSITAYYYKDNGNEIRNRREILNPNKKNIVSLSHSIGNTEYAEIIYHVKINNSNEKKVIHNTANISDCSYGSNNNDGKRTNWISNNTIVNVNPNEKKSRIIVRYRDRQNESHKLAEDEVLTSKIGETKKIQPKAIDGSNENWTVVDSSELLNPSWTSTSFPDWELARDYDVVFAKDEQIITYRYEKSRIGIITDKYWDFGKQKIENKDNNYYLKTIGNRKRPYSVCVEDYYTSKGWTLNVRQDDQFSTSDRKKYLDNAVLSFDNGHVVFEKGDDIGQNAHVKELITSFMLQPKGDSISVMTYKSDKPNLGYYATHGFGVWRYQFGSDKDADKSIKLHVPASTKRYSEKYTAQLTWSLVIAE